MGEIHETAAGGFNIAAEVYATARPSYPLDAVDWMIGRLRLDVGSPVVDLAAGTGKLTVELARRGVACIAVEPVAGMRAQLVKLLPDATVLDGTAERIPLPDGYVSAMTVGQAFHWFRFSEALAEIHRVLVPKGRLALLWNLRDDRLDWVSRITEIIDPHSQGSGVGIPRHRDRAWQPVIESSPLFRKLDEARFEHVQPMTVEGLVERILSTSFIAVLPEAEQAGVLTQIRDLAATHPDLAGRDEFSFPYICEIAIYERA